VLLTACLSLAACSGGAKAAPSANKEIGTTAVEPLSSEAHQGKVLISGFKFQPETLTINAGDTIEFTNADLYPHTATAKAIGNLPAFDSGSIASHASWRLVVKTKGTYNYICTFHPNMRGKLIVR